MSLKNGVVFLFGQVEVNSVQVSDSEAGKTSPDFNIPNNMFHCQFDTLQYHALSCSSTYIHPPVAAINLKLGFSSKQDFFQSSAVKCWYFLAHPKCLAWSLLLRSGLENASHPLRQGSFPLTVLLLIGVVHSLFNKCD